jgi:ADP-dependent NAD(P)H-hydrate dehydratase / NAD(P)H-hydrate epimerase
LLRTYEGSDPLSPLPRWLDALYDAAEVRAADAWAIEDQGVPEDDLMARAALGLARVTAAVASEGPIRIVAGKGNNGGDGRVAARLLAEDGHEVEVIDGTEPFDPERLAGSGAVVDALLGTGFEGAPREPVASAIWAINREQAPVVACDVPSGVNASTGEVEAEAVQALATATFHGSKVGLHVNPGKQHAGRVEVAEIGIPRGAPEPAAAGLISARVLDLYPHRGRSGSKFDSGVVVVVGGSAGLTGAPTMAARSASRAGAGYVRVAVPQPVQQTVDLRLLEQMSRGLPDDDGFHTPQGIADVEEMAERAGAVVLGPGLGRAEGAQEFARGVAVAVEAPLLVDADGLNAHAGRLELFRERSAPTVLTPHEAELGRLLGVEPDEVAAHRVEHVREAAELSGAVVLLKGDDTIVALPGGPLAISPGGTPALATAGTGDVLSGLIGALLAKRLDPFEAASLGALAHALAARHAAGLVGTDHVMAGDVIEALPHGLTLR